LNAVNLCFRAQIEVDDGPLTHFALDLDLDLPPLPFADTFDNGETNAAAATLRAAVMTLEDLFELRFRDARAGVADLNVKGSSLDIT